MIGGTNLRQRRRVTHQTDKKELLANADTNKKPNNDGQQDEINKSVKSSLERTKQMMKSELERVSHVTNVIDTDGQALNKTREEQQELGDAGKGAKGSLQRLKLEEQKENIIFWSSVVFFYLVVIYVVWSRIRIPFILW